MKAPRVPAGDGVTHNRGALRGTQESHPYELHSNDFVERIGRTLFDECFSVERSKACYQNTTQEA